MLQMETELAEALGLLSALTDSFVTNYSWDRSDRARIAAGAGMPSIAGTISKKLNQTFYETFDAIRELRRAAAIADIHNDAKAGER